MKHEKEMRTFKENWYKKKALGTSHFRKKDLFADRFNLI